MGKGSSYCVGNIVGVDLGLSEVDAVWVLGDSFMENVYTVFSVDPSNFTGTVGFATLSDDTSA